MCDEKGDIVTYLEGFHNVSAMPSTTRFLSKAELYYSILDANAYYSLVKTNNPHFNFKVKTVMCHTRKKIKLID